MKAIWLLALFLCIHNCNGRHFLDSFFHRYKPRIPLVESKLSDQVCEDDPNYADKCGEKAAIEGYCKDQEEFMKKECPKSCGFCSPGTQKPPAPAVCEDDPNYVDMCAEKAAIKDYCVDQKAFMEKECPKSCGFCSSSTQKPPAPTVCEDDPNYADKCAEKAAITNYCVDQKKFMEKECPKSCGFCP